VSDGIEIGALHRPAPVPPGARVRYVDRAPTSYLCAEHPDVSPVAVDVVDDAQTLATFADASLDFVIARHVLELCEDPLGALHAMTRVLRPGGELRLTLGVRGTGIDERRFAVSLEHLRADHADGGAGTRAQHYREWAELVDLPLGFVAAEDVAAHAAALERGGHEIRFHCWTEDEARELLAAAGLQATVRREGDELVVLAQR
jgi:SAM-dependent methyltransferase